jgi:hypothetical protein
MVRLRARRSVYSKNVSTLTKKKKSYKKKVKTSYKKKRNLLTSLRRQRQSKRTRYCLTRQRLVRWSGLTSSMSL